MQRQGARVTSFPFAKRGAFAFVRLAKSDPNGIKDNLKERLVGQCIYTYIGHARTPGALATRVCVCVCVWKAHARRKGRLSRGAFSAK